MAREQYDMVNEVLAHFDFEKVKEVMDAIGWRWAGAKKGVPTIKELKESAERHLYSAIEQVLSPDNKEHYEVGFQSYSGGLKAMAWKKEDGTLARIQLEFIVTEWDADDDSEVAK